MNKKLILVVMTAGVMLAGCASDPVQVAKDMEQARQEAAIDNAKAMLDTVPDWYTQTPQSDESGMYGAGSATSKDMNIAMKKARLQAEFELAKMYKQELSGSERVYERENAAGELVQTSQFLIDKLVDSVPLVGYTIVEQKLMVAPQGGFLAYTLLKLPYDEFNRVLQSAKAESQDEREVTAFNDLERRLQQRRQEKEQEKQKDHERKLETMDMQRKVLTEPEAPVKAAPAPQAAVSTAKQPAVDLGALFR